jgi:hypothetical protein
LFRWNKKFKPTSDQTRVNSVELNETDFENL